MMDFIVGIFVSWCSSSMLVCPFFRKIILKASFWIVCNSLTLDLQVIFQIGQEFRRIGRMYVYE